MIPFRIDGDMRSTLLSDEYALALTTMHTDNLTAAWHIGLYIMGHCRIACISGPAQLPACQPRLEGIVCAAASRHRAAITRRLPRRAKLPDRQSVT
ncbi:MAG: hypothetical protein GPOALKHO_001039 [Sodalis sp.]|uniref:hypothetical protein n=1 Tax=Sodalis sp. (in: enterobacteria) TaxID=1898979 RepID=UPI003873A83D|nr:MAG: hypothetical protein GPOALKHO_001039 [Sodalis sp.]